MEWILRVLAVVAIVAAMVFVCVVIAYEGSFWWRVGMMLGLMSLGSEAINQAKAADKIWRSRKP